MNPFESNVQMWYTPRRDRNSRLSTNGRKAMDHTRTLTILALFGLTTLACASGSGDGSRGGDAASEIGRPSADVTAPAALPYVGVGTDYSCGVRRSGTVVCWGEEVPGGETPLADTFIQVGGGESHTCGLKADGSIVCWGIDADGSCTLARLSSSPPGWTTLVLSAGTGALPAGEPIPLAKVRRRQALSFRSPPGTARRAGSR
jgi:hypothetical protein